MAAAIPNQNKVIFPDLPQALTQQEGQKELNITRFLGSGTFGEVYLLKSHDVIKVFKKGMEVYYYKEAQIHKKINKLAPAKFLLIAEFFGVFQTPERFVFGLIFENGGVNLIEIITKISKEKQHLSDDWIRNAMMQGLEGLKELHLRNFLHLDIKPENLLFNASTNCLKIADFGSAKFFDKDGTVQRSSARVMCSPWYRPPECEIDSKIGAPADLWSLGCVLFELLTLKPIFGQKGDCNHATPERVLLLEKILQTIPAPCPIEKKQWPLYNEYDSSVRRTLFELNMDITPGKNQEWKVALENRHPQWRSLLERFFQFSANRITTEDSLEFLKTAENFTFKSKHNTE